MKNEPRRTRPRRSPASSASSLGLLAFCAFLCEGGANDWSAVHLRSERAASETLAAAAFVAFSLALALGRLAGDRVVALLGRAGAVRGGGLVAAGGLGVAIGTSAVAPALVGWAVFGAGLSLLAPTIIGAAPTAIAGVTTCGYLGSFTGPPLVGALAELLSLSSALGVLVEAAAGVALLAPRSLPPDRGS
ncbi:MAG TPA: hypothetical protein VEX67_13560 [Solirubrobacteraceae bacterium]|nr:hypothetical protein [Solirubrobacteraceae bacterium]